MNKQKINMLCISVHTLKHKTHKILNETFKTNKTLNTGLNQCVQNIMYFTLGGQTIQWGEKTRYRNLAHALFYFKDFAERHDIPNTVDLLCTQ